MLTQKSLDFLQDLIHNNSRDWFHAQKLRYEQDLKKPFEAFVGSVIDRIQEVDDSFILLPRQAIFRINRDTRFSKDKSPYKTHVAAIICPGGTKNKVYPGFYMHLEPSKLMLGGGAYFLEAEPLYRVRQFISLHSERFRALIQAPDFVQKYGSLQGEQNKRLQPEFTDAAKTQPLLFNKQFYYMAELSSEVALGSDALSTVFSYYQTAKGLNDFLAEAITMG